MKDYDELVRIEQTLLLEVHFVGAIRNQYVLMTL